MVGVTHQGDTMKDKSPPTTTVSTNIGAETREALETKAEAFNITRSLYIKHVLDQWVNTNQKLLIVER